MPQAGTVSLNPSFSSRGHTHTHHGGVGMRTLLYSLCAAAGLASAATAITAPGSMAWGVTPRPNTQIMISRDGKADRLPVSGLASVRVKTFSVRPVEVRRHQSPPRG